jgi:hypothetical protein
LDGTVFDLANTEDMRAAFGTPSVGRHLQARMVTLVVYGTRISRFRVMTSLDLRKSSQRSQFNVIRVSTADSHQDQKKIFG